MSDYTAYLAYFALLAIYAMCAYSILFFDNRDYIKPIRIPKRYAVGTVVRIKCPRGYPQAIVLSNETFYDCCFITLLLVLDEETGFGFRYAVPSENVTYWGETEADIAKWREKNKEIKRWCANPLGKCF